MRELREEAMRKGSPYVGASLYHRSRLFKRCHLLAAQGMLSRDRHVLACVSMCADDLWPGTCFRCFVCLDVLVFVCLDILVT